MIRRLLAALFLSLVPALALAQGNFVLQTGGVIPGHAPMWVTNGAIGDGGAALGGPPGTNLTEIGITNTGTPWCITDVPNTSPYHQLCFGANTLLGYGVLSFNPYGGAQPIPFDCIINGVFIPNCLSGGGSSPGPCSATASGLVPATGGGTANFLRADCTFAAPPGGGGNTITITANPCISATPNPITGVGTISTVVPFTVPCGGTGDVTLTANSVLLGQGTSAVTFATVGTDGRFLRDNGSGTDPTFTAIACSDLPAGGCPFDIAMTWNGVPATYTNCTTPTDSCVNVAITRAASCPAAFSGSIGLAQVASTGTAVVNVNQITSGTPTTRGTATFTTSATGVFASASGMTLAAGDIVQFAFPTTADATLADIAITLKCTRT